MKKSTTYIIFGLLVSVYSPMQANADPLPPGSYQQSCSNCSVKSQDAGFGTKQTTLSCDCRDRGGAQHHTEITYTACPNPISNCDGRLVCKECD